MPVRNRGNGARKEHGQSDSKLRPHLLLRLSKRVCRAVVPGGRLSPRTEKPIKRASPPRCIVIAGPNGAGKTTFAKEFLVSHTKVIHFINADLIAAGLSPLRPELAAITAGRTFLKELDRHARGAEDFAFESTLSGRSYVPRLRRWKIAGYRIEVVYLALPSPEIALRRIAARVQQEGTTFRGAMFSGVSTRAGRTFSPCTSRLPTGGVCTTMRQSVRSSSEGPIDQEPNRKGQGALTSSRARPPCRRATGKEDGEDVWHADLYLAGRKGRHQEAVDAASRRFRLRQQTDPSDSYRRLESRIVRCFNVSMLAGWCQGSNRDFEPDLRQGSGEPDSPAPGEA